MSNPSPSDTTIEVIGTPPPTDYIILTCDDEKDLMVDVCRKISQGWRPTGGIAMASAFRECLIWAQAMVK